MEELSLFKGKWIRICILNLWFILLYLINFSICWHRIKKWIIFFVHPKKNDLLIDRDFWSFASIELTQVENFRKCGKKKLRKENMYGASR